MKFPIATAELFDVMPHKPPMVWVDEVLEFYDDERGLGGVCRVFYRPDRLFCTSDGVPRASAVIEWIAQGYGFIKGCQFKFGGTQMLRGYLVGITSCEVQLDGIEKEKELIIRVHEMRVLPPASIVQGEVFNSDCSKKYGSAQVKLFADMGDGAGNIIMDTSL